MGLRPKVGWATGFPFRGWMLLDMRRLPFWSLLLLCAPLFWAGASPALADRLEETNPNDVTVDGINRTFQGGAQFENAKRKITFDGSELNFGSGDIIDVNLAITFTKNAGAEPFPEPFYNEIGFRLVSPSGDFVELVVGGAFSGTWDEGAANTSFTGTITFDDSAAAFVNAGPNAGIPNVGTFKPMNPLSAFIGENALGTWELWVEDYLGGHPLTVTNFLLSIETSPAAVPEPSSVVLGLFAFGALLTVARRRR